MVSDQIDGQKEASIEEVRRLSNGCMLYFFLPLLLIGLCIVGWAYREGQSGADVFDYYLWGTVIAAIGGVPLGVYLVKRESFLVGVQLRQNYPGQPWMWRDDWRTGIIQDMGRRSLVRVWVRAFFVLAAMLVLGWFVRGFVFDLLDEFPWQTQAVLAALGLVPLLMFGLAIYSTLRRQRFGASTLHLKKTPLEPGDRLTGWIETSLAEVPQEGASICLTCLKYIARKGEVKSRYEPIWTGSTTTESMRIVPGPAGVTIPVDIAIPYHAKTAAATGKGPIIHWRLSAQASVAGIDFSAEFELPVFRMTEDTETGESTTA